MLSDIGPVLTYSNTCCRCLLQPIILVLLDIEAMMTVLKGVAMELTDCCSPLLKGIIHGLIIGG